MASAGNQQLYKGIPDIENAFVVIVKTDWNSDIIEPLADGAKQILSIHHASFAEYIVPGAVELTFAIQHIIKNSIKPVDAVIALGAVIKGDTPHFDYVCSSVTQGITLLNATLPVPIIMGVLTVNNKEQALERIGGIHGHKGEEAAITAIRMIQFKKQVQP